MKCGHCKDSHRTVGEVRACFKGRNQPEVSNVPTMTQIADHGRAQTKPYDPEKKAAEAAARRARPTPPERCLAEALRAAGSMKFKREEIILGYVVDFFFPEVNVIVEVDGSHHREQIVRDSRRDDVLRANWYRVMRFSASEVINATESVVVKIAAQVELCQKQRRERQRRRRVAPNSNGPNTAPRTLLQTRQEVRAFDGNRKELKRDTHYDQKRRIRSTASVQRLPKQKFKFRCSACKREFVTTVRPWPQCRTCTGSPAAHRICSNTKCGKSLPTNTASWYCETCDQKTREIRESFGGGLSEYWRNGRHSRGT